MHSIPDLKHLRLSLVTVHSFDSQWQTILKESILRLRHLTLDVEYDTDFELFDCLVTPDLNSLHLEMWGFSEYSSSFLENYPRFLPKCIEIAPQLRSLRISSQYPGPEGGSGSFKKFIAPFFNRCENLQRLEVPSFTEGYGAFISELPKPLNILVLVDCGSRSWEGIAFSLSSNEEFPWEKVPKLEIRSVGLALAPEFQGSETQSGVRDELKKRGISLEIVDTNSCRTIQLH